MSDPYKVLGISPDSTDEQVKDAYRKLARKYHPDSYADNPLSDLAQDKMKEINEAYDSIMAMRRGNGSNSSSAHKGSYYTGTQFSDVRNLINSGRVIEAEEILNGVPNEKRDAEWHFLKGSVMYSKGWLDEATKYFQEAVRQNPGNPEYRAAFNRIMQQRSGAFTNSGAPYRTAGGTGGCSPCGVCQGLICADCCCECLGGDLISCC